jgi:hypothetical protein
MNDNLSRMAQRVITTLEDDLDGTEASETITFSLDGAEYEIDLNETNARELRTAMSKYTSVSRKSAARGRLARRAGTGGAKDTKAIRAWAIANGIPVSARGRVQADVMERYSAAHWGGHPERDAVPTATVKT